MDISSARLKSAFERWSFSNQTVTAHNKGNGVEEEEEEEG